MIQGAAVRFQRDAAAVTDALCLHGLFEAGTGFIDLAFVHRDA